MAIEDEQRFSIRRMEGVNQSIDARISTPGKFWATKNYYARRKGVLSPRPGSKLVSQSIKWPAGSPIGLSTPTGVIGAAIPGNPNFGKLIWSQINDRQLQQTVARPNDPTMVAVNNAKLLRPLIQNVNPSQTNLISSVTDWGAPLSVQRLTTGTYTQTTPTPYHGAMRVSALARVYFDEGPNRLLIAAINAEPPLGDKIYYLTPAGVLQICSIGTSEAGTNLITTSNANWQILPFKHAQDPNTDVNSSANTNIGYYAILTNGVDAPLVLLPSPSLSVFGQGQPPTFSSPLAEFSLIAPYVCGLNVTSQETALAGYSMVAVQSLCVFNGSIVYGGYKMWDGTQYRDFSNSIIFADPGKPYSLTSDTASSYNVIIGDSVLEPITYVCPGSVQSDAQGLASALFVFTAKKVRLFQGSPPVSGSNTVTSFAVTATADVGCSAPNTIVRTPHGIVFLGTDGFVYLIDFSGRPRVISYALENLFYGMSPRRLRSAAAAYRLGWYYLSFASGQGDVSFRPGTSFVQSDAASQAFRNDQQYWCDMRFMGASAMSEPGHDAENDFGAHWFGPMTDLYASCFAVANGPEDNNDLYIGWDHGPVISQMLLPATRTDPAHDNPVNTSPINNQMILGEFDMGNPHREKDIIAVSIGVQTDATAVISMSLLAFSDDGSQGRGDFQQFLVKPSGTTWGGSTWGGGYWTGEASFSLQPQRPSRTIRGRAFSVEFDARTPFVVTTGVNDKIDFTNTGGASSGAHAATIPAGTYLGANGSTNSLTAAQSLSATIQTALNAASTAIWTCTYDVQSNTFTIGLTSGATSAVLNWNTGANTATSAGPQIGFPTSADSASIAAGSTSLGSVTPTPAGLAPAVSFADIEVRYRVITREP